MMFMTGWDGPIVTPEATRFLCGKSEIENKRSDKDAGESAMVHR
jgi:hypothetical protein